LEYVGLILQGFKLDLLFDRVDKKFYRPAELRKWIVVIYESQRRFDGAAADRLVKELVRGARARGMYDGFINSIMR
jgi:hypothetical protein